MGAGQGSSQAQINQFAGKRATVMGLGLFGGGAAVAQYLVQQGMRVTVTDLRPAETFQEILPQLAKLDLQMILGQHREEDFTNTDLVIANPAVPMNSPYLQLAKSKNIPISSEIDLLLQACPAPCVAVTGTNGKSTTTALIGAIAQASGKFRKTWVGGNIGRSLLHDVSQIRKNDLVVLELSSFQIERLQSYENWPHVAVFTKLTKDHLDRYPDVNAYAEAKAKLLNHQNQHNKTVLPADDPLVSSWHKRTPAKIYFYGETQGNVFNLQNAIVQQTDKQLSEIIAHHEILLPGKFNQENVMAASCAAIALKIPLEKIRSAVQTFRGLEHRLEFLGEKNGVRVFNNAVSTTPESTISALASLSSPIVLVAGGKVKNLDLEALIQIIGLKVRALALFGQAGPSMAKLVKNLSTPIQVHVVDTLGQAITWSLANLKKGDTLLFSPGFSSFDQYRNFRDRGLEWKNNMLLWLREHATTNYQVKSYTFDQHI